MTTEQGTVTDISLMILFRLYVYLSCFKLILSKSDNVRLNISFSNSPDVLETLYLFSKFGLNVNPKRRIFEGEYVEDIKDYPFMAFLYLSVNGTAGMACGGSIIGLSYILTAAHCLYFCGDFDNEFTCKTPVKKHSRIYIGSTIAKYAPQVSSVKSWHIHPYFKYKDKKSNCLGLFDIGIVELDKPLQFNEEIFNVALPQPVNIGEDLSATKTTKFTKIGKTCKVLGWGKTSSHDDINAGIRQLKVATVPLIDAHQCNRYLMLTGLERNEVMCRNSQICSLDPMNKTGVCNGDSGGPIMCDGVQIGIMSYVGDEKCVGPHIVNVYTRVDVNMKFIKGVMSKGSNFSKSPDGSYTLLKLLYWICIVFNSL